MNKLLPGLSAEHASIVKETDTASHWGSGGVHVFSTPGLAGLMESAAVIALRGVLPAGQTTVGVHINLHHLAATPVGMRVHARAELASIEGCNLTFKIQAWDEVDLIGECEHQRFVIDEARFLAKIESKGK